MSIAREFREFAVKGSVVDVAIGILIGAGIQPIAKSLVDDIIMPPVGWLLGDRSFSTMHLVLQQGTPAGPYPTPAAAKAAGAITINYGLFINTALSFLIIAWVAFMIMKLTNRLRRRTGDEEVKKL